MAEAQRHRALRGRRASATAVIALALTAVLAGCGGDGEEPAAVPVAEDCLRSWNTESASLTFGRHVYEDHQSKQAQVTLLEPSKGAVSVSGPEACAVVFAVPESDVEYGDVGLVVSKLGWVSMKELARGDSARLDQIQREATAAPNANLFPDGSLDPLS